MCSGYGTQCASAGSVFYLQAGPFGRLHSTIHSFTYGRDTCCPNWGFLVAPVKWACGRTKWPCPRRAVSFHWPRTYDRLSSSPSWRLRDELQSLRWEVAEDDGGSGQGCCYLVHCEDLPLRVKQIDKPTSSSFCPRSVYGTVKFSE
jgi:hypothetical protein